MRRHTLAALVTAAGLLAAAGPAPQSRAGAPAPPARAEGPTVLSWIDLAEAVARSPYVFEATVLKVDPDWQTAQRTGKRYLRSERLEVAIGLAWRGQADIDALRGRQPHVWLQRRRAPPWAKLHDVYRSRYPLAAAKPGDSVVVMVKTLTPIPEVSDRVALLLQYIDSGSIAGLLGPAVAQAEAGRRQAGRRDASCPTPGTYYFKKQCYPPDELFTKVECPEGTKLTGKLDDERPRLWCADAANVANGPALAWRANGDIDHRGRLRAGERHGTWTDYGPQGVKQFRREYVDGKLQGPALWLHPNGKPLLKGSYTAGLADGLWSQHGADGRALGRFVLKAGTGTQRKWYPDGQLEREEALVGGVPSGPVRHWHPNGKLARQGQVAQGQKVGLWRQFSERGKLESALCYAKDRVLWETRDPSMAKPDQCRPEEEAE